MMKRPLRPLNMKSRPAQKVDYNWDPSGDITLALIALATAPIWFPYVWIKELFKKK